MKEVDIKNALLSWYGKNGRSFEWRKDRRPYIVLIAEILLKKTNAEAVARFLPVFLRQYPNINTLHEETITELRKTLSPLGLSTQRATQLKGLAKALLELYKGEIPCNKKELLKLPGIGDYIAGAILSFAYNKPEPIVDTNVARIINRLYGLIPSRCESRRSPEVWDKASRLVHGLHNKSALINWALLDLGALVCKPKHPLHNNCPLKGHCSFYTTNQGELSK